MFMNLAHRGASEYAPENTLSAFYKGIEQGANGIETDLKTSKDGVIILFHDNELNRTTNGQGLPSEYTWKELQGLDAGSWFSPAYTGERLITFEQFLYLFGRKPLLFALELKDMGIENPVLELIERFGVRKQVTITSFWYANLEAVRTLDASIRIGHLIRKIDKEAIGKLKDIGAQQICPATELLEPDDVRLAKAHGLEVRAWGAFTPELMRHALDCEVDGMTINFPDKLTKALQTSYIKK
ncbi:glycerophosphoryl diester phosphodiesterase [Paenibacillus sp. J31TS4]|uniref:glycerophosphodiester phosphodiesterase n=1 Tax=Paenibacillus sp. J31TS4 TaxID=2807195 RepID=UPI001B2C2634|nr:glycerophosphodiester phosphodiesterase family protein [Paenibacillus sp. J31TS4]GIP37075.1 glycerophosphoryl diester phosphodiesterase [Paenibacillus sp. J31TS4]